MKTVMARLADGGWFVSTLVIFILGAAEAGCCVELSVGSVNLGLELAQEPLTFFFQSNCIGIIGSGYRGCRDSFCGHSFRALTDWASLEICGVISLTFHAWQAVANSLWSNVGRGSGMLRDSGCSKFYITLGLDHALGDRLS